MANITLKDVPDDLHQCLRAAAVETGRSLNKMILTLLEKAVVGIERSWNAVRSSPSRRSNWGSPEGKGLRP
jgi:plasmid stability protein